jgi:hypothetical protein
MAKSKRAKVGTQLHCARLRMKVMMTVVTNPHPFGVDFA